MHYVAAGVLKGMYSAKTSEERGAYVREIKKKSKKAGRGGHYDSPEEMKNAGFF
jgi:hypothetical protein